MESEVREPDPARAKFGLIVGQAVAGYNNRRALPDDNPLQSMIG